MNPNFVDRQITFSRTPASNELARQKLASDVQHFRDSGGVVQQIPFGVSAIKNDNFKSLFWPHEVEV